MKYTNQDFKNLKKDYQDFIGVSENFIKELKEKELINEKMKLLYYATKKLIKELSK